MANGPLHAIFQAAVDLDVKGRVLSLVGAGATAMSPLSLLVALPIADWLGIRIWFVIGGAACILIPIAMFFVPAIMSIEENRQATDGG